MMAGFGVHQRLPAAARAQRPGCLRGLGEQQARRANPMIVVAVVSSAISSVSAFGIYPGSRARFSWHD